MPGPVCLPWEMAHQRQLGLGLQAFGHCMFWLVGYSGGISLPVLSVLASRLALEIFFQAMGLGKLQALQNPGFHDQIFAQVLREKALKL